MATGIKRIRSLPSKENGNGIRGNDKVVSEFIWPDKRVARQALNLFGTGITRDSDMTSY